MSYTDLLKNSLVGLSTSLCGACLSMSKGITGFFCILHDHPVKHEEHD
jgi:hypothetical protein